MPPHLDCAHVPDPHRSFEIHDMRTCQLYLFANEQDCRRSIAQQWYDANDQDECIGPEYQWDYFEILGC